MSAIPLSLPDITEADIAAVAAALRCPRLSCGPRQARFEEMVAERAGRRHGVAVSSGTGGLHVALTALGVGPGDEVITSPFSFIAPANAILYTGAKPVFVDIDPLSLNMDPAKVEAAITLKTKAILAVEAFGNPTHVDKLAQIARAHEIPLLEDCCGSLGGRYQGQPLGSFGRMGVFSFYPNKQITAGEGGMIVTDDEALADLCRSLRNLGRPVVPETRDANTTNQSGGLLRYDRLGFNYRFNEIGAALGIAQMERLDQILEGRRKAAALYMRKMMDWQDLILPNVPVPEDASWFVFVVRLTDQYGQTERDRVMTGLHRHDIGAANYFPCIHLQNFYRERFGYEKGMFPVAESVCHRTIALPFFNRLDDTQVELVTLTLRVMLQREKLLKR